MHSAVLWRMDGRNGQPHPQRTAVLAQCLRFGGVGSRFASQDQPAIVRLPLWICHLEDLLRGASKELFARVAEHLQQLCVYLLPLAISTELGGADTDAVQRDNPFGRWSLHVVVSKV